MFHLSNWFAALGVAASNSALAFNVEETFVRSQQSNLIVTEKYQAILLYGNAANMTDARLDSSTLAAVGRPHIYPAARSATIPDLPAVMDLRDYPMPLPVNEEIAWQASNNLGAATESSYGWMWIAPPNWSRNLPRGIQRQLVRATVTVTSVANVWTLSGALVFDENLRGGVYSVVGMWTEEADVLATRINFPTAPTVNGRKFKPGCLNLETLGNRPWASFLGGLGEWGRFHTFELPMIEVLANNAAAQSMVVYLDTIYLGGNRELLFSPM